MEPAVEIQKNDPEARPGSPGSRVASFGRSGGVGSGFRGGLADLLDGREQEPDQDPLGPVV